MDGYTTDGRRPNDDDGAHIIRLRVMRQELEKLRLLVDLVKKRETLKQSIFAGSVEMMDRDSDSSDDD